MTGQAVAGRAGAARPARRPAAPFLVDAMLGSLARKLRMMGFDAEYAAGPAALGPAALSRLAAGGRTLVTRSGPLAARARKAGASVVVLPGDGGGRRRSGEADEADLDELARQAGIAAFEARADRSRCAACNGTLAPAAVPPAPPEVPPRVAEACSEFWRCRRCSKVYWDGTHLRSLQALAARLNGRQGDHAQKGPCDSARRRCDPAGQSSVAPRDGRRAARAAAGARLTDADGAALVCAARKSIAEAVAGGRPRPDAALRSRFPRRSGAFVTLTMDGRLRGCIGHPLPDMSLCGAVVDSAASAATLDPRFSPVSPGELDGVAVEVTVLSEPEKIRSADPAQRDLHVRVGRDGLIVRSGGAAGLLLPQVPVEYGWGPREFLEHACEKAGLGPNCWMDPAVTVERFEGRIFAEDRPGGAVSERPVG